MNYDQLIKDLKEEVAKNPVAADVLTSWGARKRARCQVTVVALTQRMEKEGFKHSRADYGSFLIKLAHKGVGQLKRSASGRTIGLMGIKVSLQSLGKAVIDNSKIEELQRRSVYHDVTAPSVERKQEKPGAGAVSAGPQVPWDGVDRRKPSPSEHPMSLVFYIHGKPVSIPLPQDFSPDDLRYLVSKLKSNELL